MSYSNENKPLLNRRTLLSGVAMSLFTPEAQGNQPPAAPSPPLPTSLSAITGLAFSPDGKRLAVGTWGRVVLYDAATWHPVGTCTKLEDFARSLAYHPDGKTLGIGSGQPAQYGRVTLWQTETNQADVLTKTAADTVEALAFRKDGDALLFGSSSHKACYLTRLTGGQATQLASYLDEHNGRVLSVAFSPKPDWVFITGSMDRIVKVWDEKMQKTVVNFDQAESGVTGLAFLNNGDQFVGAGLDGRLNWWGVSYDKKKQAYGGYHFRRLDAHPGGVLCLGRAHDGRRFATGGQDRAVGVWELDSGNRQREFKDATQPIYAVALNPDGKVLATGGREGIVRLYDVEANKPLTTLLLPPSPGKAR